MIRLAALAAMALLLGGCDAVDCAGTMDNRCMDPGYAERLQANRAKMSSHFTAEDRPFRSTIVRHDDKRGVTCWVYSAPNAEGGISCIPDWMLTAPKGGLAVRP